MKDPTPNYEGLIAACGMNCGVCIGHLRDKKPCGGCFKIDDAHKPNSCRSCSIVNCEKLAGSKSGFCYECKIYPCARLKKLDKRYRSKYGMSMIENLDYIKQSGIEAFLQHEQQRWSCKKCGAGISVHRDYCLNCKADRN